uniref:GNAT family N-acetyltransferase n=1 Tax=Eiseniibacteriota bacterium TaxID=2212470 RepID=A0A832HZN0_UNCEI
MADEFIEVRLMDAAEAAVLNRVDPDVFDHAVQPRLAAQFLSSSGGLLAVAIHDGVVVGMATGMAYVHPDKPLQLFINEVGVSARYRRRGLGARLVRALLDHARRIGCAEAWVATEEDNAAARRLYEALGGREDEARAVVYTWKLGEEEGQGT